MSIYECSSTLLERLKCAEFLALDPSSEDCLGDRSGVSFGALVLGSGMIILLHDFEFLK